MSWTIAILGSNTFIEPDENSCVELADLGTVDPMTDAGWVKVEVIGVSPLKKHFEGPEIGTGGIARQRGAQYRSFRIETELFIFPDDMTDLDALMSALDNNYIYLYRGDYTFEDYNIHPDNMAILCVLEGKIEDDYPHGAKSVILEGRKVLPE